MQFQDAEAIIIRWIRERPTSQYPNYGYDIYIPNVIRGYLHFTGLRDHHEVEQQVRTLSSTFYTAAWELCRRGVIRPGVREMGLQATPEGSAGDGYSITPFGAQWATESDRDDFVPTEPQRFAQMLEPYQPQFGPGFYERAQEAVRCYGAHAYLACCAMCGAAAESILLAVVGLPDTGSTVNVLPYPMGLQLGLVWEQQTTRVQLTGSLARLPARGVIVSGQVASFPPVDLVFAWTQSSDVPTILEQVNFFMEFDVCFFRSQAAFDVNPKGEAPGGQ